MKYTNYLVSVSFYVKGEQIDPDRISGIMGTPCTRGRRKGDRSGTGPNDIPVYGRTGIWVLKSIINSKSLSDHLYDLIGKVTLSYDDLQNLEAFDEAFFDIFIALNPGEKDGSSSMNFMLSSDLLSKINSLGYPLMWTLDYVTP